MLKYLPQILASIGLLLDIVGAYGDLPEDFPDDDFKDIFYPDCSPEEAVAEDFFND